MNFIYRYGDKNKTIHTVVKKNFTYKEGWRKTVFTHIGKQLCAWQLKKKDASIDREGQ